VAVVGYFQARHGEEGFDVNGIIDAMILLARDPDRVKKEVVDTVSTLVKISGKSLRSLERLCSILRLPKEIQNALREGRLPEALDDGAPAAKGRAKPEMKRGNRRRSHRRG
jgi:hypothetical protein